MNLTTTAKDDLRVLIFSFFYCALLMLLISPDSYLHALFGRCDSAWFFSAGKAMMNGLIPYVDFADSKGPLLWLIYGIGYLISPHDYTGVFWLSVLSYTFTLFFLYRAARCLHFSSMVALIGAALMTLAFFYYPIHFEVKTEDFACLFQAISVWALCQLLSDKSLSCKKAMKLSAALGLCTSALVLMKFNLAFMQLSIVLCAAIIIAAHGKKNFAKSLFAYLVGFLLLFAPFAIYLLSIGAFDGFIAEYFVSTSHLVSKVNDSWGFQLLLQEAMGNKFVALYLLLLCAGVVAACVKLGRLWWMPLLVSAGFIIVVARGYYCLYHLTALSILLFPLMLWLASGICRISKKHWLMCVVIVMIFVAACVINYPGIKATFLPTRDLLTEQDYNNACSQVAKNDNTKILYFNTGDYGLGTPGDALPACKYWARQNGAGVTVINAQKLAIKRHLPTAVVVDLNEPQDNVQQFLLQCGYNLVDTVEPTTDARLLIYEIK